MPRTKTPKVTIRQNRYDNWHGYIGGRRVQEFYNDRQGTQEDHAREWLAAQLLSQRPSDFVVSGGGTVYIFMPLTPAANAWLKEHVITEETLTLGGNGVVVEHRYIADLVVGARRDGLVVR